MGQRCGERKRDEEEEEREEKGAQTVTVSGNDQGHMCSALTLGRTRIKDGREFTTGDFD